LTAGSHQRARGALDITVRTIDGDTRLADLRQQGCLRACFPRAEPSAFQAIVLNTSGGITDGDILHTRLAAGAGASMVVATQAAERIYRARAGATPACVNVHITVGSRARMEYLPQETILFDACALGRRLAVEMAADSVYLGVETLVFGRVASGEVLRTIRLRDTIGLRRDGRLVLHDCVRLDTDAEALLSSAATAGGGGAVASILYAASDAASRLAPLRDALAGEGRHNGASCRDGVLVCRIVARDGAMARRAVVAALSALRDKKPLPRVWSC
jgi:urease accessory protein